MKVLAVILLVAVAAHGFPQHLDGGHPAPAPELTLDELIELTVAFFRDILKNGYPDIGLPVLDPLATAAKHILLPGTLISLDLNLTEASVSGLGDFRADHLSLDLQTMRLQYDIVIPVIQLRAAHYKHTGLVYQALPIYGDGVADYDIVDLRMLGAAQLGQSADGKSIIIEDISEAVFSLRTVVARTTGIIGGGDVDNVINAIVSDLAADYVTRFSRKISLLTTPHIRTAFNGVLEHLDTWHLLPKP